uniref:Uncharacterized protein n=1 Tax=Rhizophora mucronata TaxID=61149 RepID=A0A2P2MZN5_RHIMU
MCRAVQASQVPKCCLIPWSLRQSSLHCRIRSILLSAAARPHLTGRGTIKCLARQSLKQLIY